MAEKVAIPVKKSEILNASEPVKEVRVEAKQMRSGGCSLVNNYSWDKRVAYAICMAESGGNSNATNLNDNHGSCIGSYGLFQIGCIHGGVFYDPHQNVAKAYEIYQRSGWTPWSAYNNGSYLKHI